MSNNYSKKYKLLIFIVAYHAESTIKDVLKRIPQSLSQLFEVEVLIIDDSSKDDTFKTSMEFLEKNSYPYTTTVLYNPDNQGYGGNQKIGYHYAIKNKFDYVALLHGDGQYAPECLNALIEPLLKNQAEAVFGSRMLKRREALKGGMPLYKYVGNKILTWFENKMLKSNLSEFHSGYRIYSVNALSKIPFSLNTNDFHFDTEIIVQLIFAKLRIVELPIPTYYGDEICRVNGMKYALDVVISVTLARIQKYGLFYRANFDCRSANEHQKAHMLDFRGIHTEVLNQIKPQSRILDLGCGAGELAISLRKKKGCYVVGVDKFPPTSSNAFDKFLQADLNDGIPLIDVTDFDFILLLDVVEHLASPEKFLENLHLSLSHNQKVKIIASTGNVAFIVQRLMLLLGQFNYGKRGILDLTHTRLFTVTSFSRLFQQRGFKVTELKGFPAPYSLALESHVLSKFLSGMHLNAIRLSKSLFSYQIYLQATANPSIDTLLIRAEQSAQSRRNSAL